MVVLVKIFVFNEELIKMEISARDFVLQSNANQINNTVSFLLTPLRVVHNLPSAFPNQWIPTEISVLSNNVLSYASKSSFFAQDLQYNWVARKTIFAYQEEQVTQANYVLENVQLLAIRFLKSNARVK